VIIDHLTPPMTRAETHGVLATLEALVDEFYEAASLDARRAEHLRKQIESHMATSGLDKDLAVSPEADEATKLTKLDDYLCDIKEAQIRDGLHILGTSPQDVQRRDLIKALVRVPRGDVTGANAPTNAPTNAIGPPLGIWPSLRFWRMSRMHRGAPMATRSSGWRLWPIRC